MKRMFCLVPILLIAGITANTSHGAHYWARTYGGEGFDNFSALQPTADEGYIVLGAANSYGEGNDDFWILKLNGSGDVMWQKSYGGAGADKAESILQAADGGYIVLGTTYSFGNGASWALKLDSDGNVIWQRIYGVSNNTIAKSIQQTTGGGYIVAGSAYLPDAGGWDFWVLKLDEDGNPAWQKTYGGTSGDNAQDNAESILPTADGGYIVVGRTSSFGVELESIWVVKLDNNGGVTWQNTYNGSGLIYRPASILQTAGGQYIVCGWAYSPIVGDVAWVMELDGDGNLTWRKTYGSAGLNGAFSIVETAGGYLAAGDIDSNGALLKLDSNGNVIWQKTYGGSSNDVFNLVQQSATDGGYMVAGATGSFGAGESDAWVLKLDENGEIYNCPYMSTSYVVITDTSEAGQATNANIQTTFVTPVDTSIIAQDTVAAVMTICSWIDSDNDGIADSEDTCPFHPNSPLLGICVGAFGPVGKTCVSDEECGTSGLASCCMNQGCSPGCDCKSNFDCDGDVDGTDGARFKADFGRALFNNPCNSQDTCNGDFECDGDVDGRDASDFKRYFGRSVIGGYCISCVDGVYQFSCSY